ncbi:MAG: C40 family peptidase [Treponema sp.]|jgi:probable lipoprotein NlpC|nr:C40 family peptidase [Treponema sp.]
MYRLIFPQKIPILTAIAVFFAWGLWAAPLEGGFALAPRSSASPEEKTAAYREARFKVLTVAGSYEKTPYRYGGLDNRGLDCSGLVYVSFREALGVTVPRSVGSLYSWVEKIQIEKAQPGDLLFFKTTNTGNISHVGIYVGGGRFIHAASDGPVTGVMYSGLDENYWSRTYAGAGRVLPEADINTPQVSGGREPGSIGGAGGTDAGSYPGRSEPPNSGNAAAKNSSFNLNLGIALAPTWNGFLQRETIIRGIAGQFRLGTTTQIFDQPLQLGLELRPEWDGALGVFRVPLTLSVGKDSIFRVFAGPVLSFGDASLSVAGQDRHYSGGTSWLGAAGITFSPFSVKIARGHLAPYGELAWQSYFSDESEINLGADFAAGFRFSTGLRYSWNIR